MTTEAGGAVGRGVGDEATRRGRRPLARWRPSAAVGAMVLAVLLSQAVAGGVLLAAGGSRTAMALGLVLADAVILAVVLLFARRGAERLTPATLGIRRTRLWRAVGWMLAIYVGVIAFEGLWTLLLAIVEGGVHGRRPAGPALHVGTPVALLVLLALAVVAPIAEEVSFRGYLFPALSRWRGPWSAAAVTALLFGAAHAFVYPPLLLPLMVAFGFGSCLLFWITGSLLPCVALHALNNSLVAAIALGWSWQVPLAVAGCVATALAVLAPLARQRAPQAAASSG
ncbi:MAG: protease family protein [Solirubrobacteraceae bacterium]|jgi:membrane protease YdiL (CAAX protease family)|nr:protease family protein [Solirubrobacteraceae bacterium]